MENRRQLYQRRGISMCMESAFDFVRVNISSWLFLSALTLAVPSFALAFLFTKNHASYYHQVGLGQTFNSFFSETTLLLVFLAIGLWGSIWVSYSLLSAYFDGRLPGKRLSLKEAWRYMRGVLVTTLAVTLIAVLLCLLITIHPIFILVVIIIGIPLLLLAPVWIVEQTSFSEALGKSFRLGFSSWFQIAFLVLIVALFCMMMMTSVFVLWVFYEVFFETLIPRGASTSYMFILQVIELTLSALFCLAFFLMNSIVTLSCVFYYGNLSESIDDTTIENDIENFENL